MYEDLLYKYYMDINIDKLYELLINNKGNKVYLDDNLYYHATKDKRYILDSIYKNGIVCKNNLNKIYLMNDIEYTGNYNGNDRVSVTKYSDINDKIPSAYKEFIRKKVSFIIDGNINAFKVPYIEEVKKIKNYKGICSNYFDEWQVNESIKPDKIKYIGMYLLDRLKENDYITFSVILKSYNVISWIKDNNINLDFIDLSDNTIINKELILTHFKKVKKK